jgi:site-specific recombinase XerD
MSEKYKLLDTGCTAQASKRPRCTVEIATLYERKEGRPGTSQDAIPATGEDRRRHILAMVRDLFGPRTAQTPAALGCETYLRDALFRWLVATCRSEDSWSSYGARLWRWVRDTGRRSLSAQTDAGPRVVANWLYALEAEGRAPRTIVTYRETLRSWFTWLFDRDLIRRSPITRDICRLHRVDRGAVQKANGRRQALTLAEAQRVARWALDAATLPEAGLSVLLQVTAGLRSQEVARLERRHLVEREGVVTLTVPGKGQRTRSVTLEPIAVAAWRRYVAERRRQGERGPLLLAPGGGHYGRRTVQRWAKAAADVVGRRLEISSHDLRKTAATQLLLRGASIEQVQELLGHASADTTLTCYVTDRRPLAVTTGITSEGTP